MFFLFIRPFCRSIHSYWWWFWSCHLSVHQLPEPTDRNIQMLLLMRVKNAVAISMREEEEEAEGENKSKTERSVLKSNKYLFRKSLRIQNSEPWSANTHNVSLSYEEKCNPIHEEKKKKKKNENMKRQVQQTSTPLTKTKPNQWSILRVF